MPPVPQSGGNLFLRGEKTAVGDDPPDLLRQCKARGHQHRSRPLGTAQQIDWHPRRFAALEIAHPRQTVIALQHPEPQVLSLTGPVAPLVHKEQVAPLFL